MQAFAVWSIMAITLIAYVVQQAALHADDQVIITLAQGSNIDL